MDSGAQRKPVPFPLVHIQDSFWAPRQKVYREKTIPHSWQYVQREIEDNEITAGWKQMERGMQRGEDTPWNQANLHKVLETCAYSLGQERDLELDRKVDSIISAIAGAQQPNGYVNALVTVRQMTPWTNLDGQHDGYVAGHLIEAAVAHHLSTGKQSFLEIACRAADHVYQHFMVEKHEGVCGHAGLELALVRLYRVTKEKRYLGLAKDWIERRGQHWHYSSDTARSYFMDHLPIRQVPEVTGHAVRTMFYLTGVAEVGLETGDLESQDAARRLWLDTTRRKMYITGSVGSQEKDEGFGPAYELPNRPGYSESCAACGLLYYAHAMFTLDGDAKSMDVLERVLYNGILHGISLDGVSTYYRNPLSDENNPRGNIWVCCPPCLSRTLLRVQEYIYAYGSYDIYVNLYIGSAVKIPLEQGSVVVTQVTQYPWQGTVKLTIHPEREQHFSLRLRIPGWARGATMNLNGKLITAPRMEKGYALIERNWKPGDTLVLDLPMPVERMEADPAVRANRGMAALQRGPVVYGFEGLDNGGNVEITLPLYPELKSEYRPGFLGGVTLVTGETADQKPFTAIPFYTLANREKSRQVVWVRQEGKQENPAGWKDRLYRPLEAGALNSGGIDAGVRGNTI